MLRTLQEKQKSDLKSHFPGTTHANNTAAHVSTVFSPFYLMYGRQPRLEIDALLSTGDDALEARHPSDYVSKLQSKKISNESPFDLCLGSRIQRGKRG